jgi:hypothetical protein
MTLTEVATIDLIPDVVVPTCCDDAATPSAGEHNHETARYGNDHGFL